MSENSPILSLAFIAPAQAQKHVTHNDAIEALDVLVQLAVAAFGTAAPPESPADGEVHALGTGTSGEWEGHDGELAAFVGGGWRFFKPRDGWIATEAETGSIRVFQDGLWMGQSLGTLGKLGINAEADGTNRMVVAGDATLLTHDGGDHRVKVNKADAAATASLLFQSDFGGRAEMGLAGEDAWSIKVSADGGDWTTALRFDPETGIAGGAAVQQSPGDTTPGRLMRADYGFGRGDILGEVGLEGGVPTGGVIESGGAANARYIRFADGTQICYGSFTEANVNFRHSRAGGYMGQVSTISFNVPFAAAPAMSFTIPGWIDALPKGSIVNPNSFAPQFWSAITQVSNVEASYIAVGRWL